MSLMGKTLPSFQSMSLLFFGFFVCWFVCFVLFCFVLFWFGLVWFGLVWFGFGFICFSVCFLERAVSFSQLAYEYQIFLPQSWSIKYSLKTKSSFTTALFVSITAKAHRDQFVVRNFLGVV